MGARPYGDILDDLSGRLLNQFDLNFLNNSQSRAAISALMKSTTLGTEPYGLTDANKNGTLIYINSSKIPGHKEMITAWDHEIGHFIQGSDGSNKSLVEDLMQFQGTVYGIDAAVSATGTLIAAYVDSHRKGEDFLEYINENKDNIMKKWLKSFKLNIIPSVIVAPTIQYSVFDDNEAYAREFAKKYPTSPEEFRNMFYIQVNS